MPWSQESIIGLHYVLVFLFKLGIICSMRFDWLDSTVVFGESWLIQTVAPSLLTILDLTHACFNFAFFSIYIVFRVIKHG